MLTFSGTVRHRYRCPRCGRERVYRRKVDLACGSCFDRYALEGRLQPVESWLV